MSKATSAKKQFIEEMTKVVGAPDRFGHFKFDGKGGYVGTSYRVRINGVSWRLERKIIDRWVKSTGAYFSAGESIALAKAEVEKRRNAPNE